MRDASNPTMFRSTDDIRDWAEVQARSLDETAEVLRATVPGLIQAFASRLRDTCGLGEVPSAVAAGALVRPLLVVAESCVMSAKGVRFFVKKMDDDFADRVREAEALAEARGRNTAAGLRV